MYISPYLEDFRERIVLNRRMISREDLTALAAEVRTAVERMVNSGMDHPTEFEIITALALAYYSRSGADYVSLEVGLGGRFDATNVVAPAVSTITTISFDHMDRLGDSLGKIAFEKAGIIKPGVPVVTGAHAPEPLSVIRRRADELGSPLYLVAQSKEADVTWEEVSSDMSGQTVNVFGPGFEYRDLHIPLLGRHQQQNAAMAVSSLELARPKTRLGKIYLDRAAVAHGISTTVWPGRLEVLSHRPMVILDGAHNPDSARVLAEAIAAVPRRRLICVLGILGDKSYKEATASVGPLCDEVIVTRPDTPRALDPEVLAREAAKYSEVTLVEPDIGKALDAALAKASADDVVLCCGSLYLVGPARTHLRGRLGMIGHKTE
jgi:dihydrofolate synthase/folylpolyglutamate synthase